MTHNLYLDKRAHPKIGGILFSLLWVSSRAFADEGVAPETSPVSTRNKSHPPGETLLTVSDVGDLWIKGHLYDYAFQSTITLDPNRDYWTLRDAAGKIVWALEVYNPTTGVSTGDLHAACTFESYCYNVEQDDAIFTCRTASGEAVYTLSASRRTKAKGNNLTQTQPKDFHGPPASYTPPTPDANAPAPNFLEDLEPYLSPEYWGTYLYIPQAQARIVCFADPQNYSFQARDVTNTAWRIRLDPSKTTLAAYGLSDKLRCTNAVDVYLGYPFPARWRYATGSEDDVWIVEDVYGGTGWLPAEDTYWTFVSASPATLSTHK